MIKTVDAPNGGYRFIPGVSQYSAGVAALSGFALERVRFTKPVPLRQGFERIAQTVAFGTEDRKEGTQAFLEKRKAEFKGC